MNTNRVEQITASLAGLGTSPAQGYSNKEIISRLIDLENALLAVVYEKNHAENMRPQDLTKHFAALAEEFGLEKSPTYKRFTTNMDELDFAVKTFIGGQKGEQLARGSMRPLTFDRNVKILYNIALENEDMKTEYDAIVLAPYGLFVVEVKNWNGDVTLTKDGFLTRKGGAISTNLAARMLVKETLLRECLGDLFPESYHNILLFPENKTRLNDEYHRLPIGYGAAVTNCVRGYENTHTKISSDQIDAMIERLSANHIEQLTYCTVQCNEIIEDFALLMAQMESASNADAEEDGLEFAVTTTVEIPDEIGDLFSRGKEALSTIDWTPVRNVAGITLAFATGLVASRVLRKNS